MNDPRVGKSKKSGRFAQEQYTKPQQDAMLAGAGEEGKFIKCFDDITGKELLWQAVKQAHEQQLKYLCELGVYDKVDEHAAVAQYNVTPIDTKWVDTDKAFEGDRCKSVHELLPESSKMETGWTCVRELPLEGLKAIISIAARHSPVFSLMHVDVSRAYFHAKAQRPVLVILPAEDCSRKGQRETQTAEEEHVRYQRCSKQLGTRLTRASRKLGLRAGAQHKTLVPQQEKENLGFETRRRLRGDKIERGVCWN